MLDRVFVCSKCHSLCLIEDWNEKTRKCAYCSTNKYHASTIEVDGETFDSKHEAGAYYQLRLLERQGIIRDLERQPAFILEINGVRICKYIADFRYVQIATGKVETVDAKGMRTPAYKLKKRLMKALLGIDVIEM